MLVDGMGCESNVRNDMIAAGGGDVAADAVIFVHNWQYVCSLVTPCKIWVQKMQF